MFVVDIKFKGDKGELKNCAVFEGWEKGQLSVQDENRIYEILKSSRTVMFQNTCCNGKTHTSNIEKYEIKYIDEEKF